MKKTSLVSLMSFIFLLISSIVAYCLRFINETDPIRFLVIGLIVLAASGILAFFAKKRTFLNIVCFSLSAIALGFVIRAWYVLRGFDNSLLTMILVSIACLVYLWIFFFLTSAPFIRNHKIAFYWIFLVLSIVGYIFVVIYTKTTFVSTFGYYMIVEAAFTFAILICGENSSTRDVIRAITISTYSVLVVAVIVLLFCLSDGDGLDFDIGGKNSSKSTSTIKTSPKKVYRDDDYYLISSLVDSATDSMTVSEINKKHKKKEHEKEEEEF